MQFGTFEKQIFVHIRESPVMYIIAIITSLENTCSSTNVQGEAAAFQQPKSGSPSLTLVARGLTRTESLLQNKFLRNERNNEKS